MARTPFRDVQQIAATALTDAYTVGPGINSTISVVGFTNTTSTAIVIDIYHNDGTDDFLKHTILLPAGSGTERLYYGMERAVLETSDILKVQADSTNAFNLFIYGSEVEV